MENGVGDSSGYANDSNLAKTLDAKGMAAAVIFFNHDDIQIRHICLSGNQSLGEVCIHPAAVVPVKTRLFHQCLSQPPYHSAQELTMGKGWIHDATTAKGAYQTLNPESTQLRIYQHFDELCAKCSASYLGWIDLICGTGLGFKVIQLVTRQ